MLQLFCKLQTNVYFCITQKLQKVKRSMGNLRFEVVKEAFRKRPVELELPNERPSELFGKYVFNRDKMY